MNDLVSAPKMVLGSFIRNWFPVDDDDITLSPRAQDSLLLQVGGWEGSCWGAPLGGAVLHRWLGGGCWGGGGALGSAWRGVLWGLL